jgi:hypothetical protein
MMPTPDKSASIIAFEREILRLLCDPRAQPDAKSREQAVLSLQTHPWQDAEHRIVFEALAKLPGRDASELRRQLPAQATRMGFPDVHWETYFASDGSSRSIHGPELNGSSLDALVARLCAGSRDPAS